MKSWQTSLGGLGMILTAVCAIVNRWTTTGTLSVTMEDIGLLSGGAGLLRARDHGLTSEQAGCVKPAPMVPPAAPITDPSTKV